MTCSSITYSWSLLFCMYAGGGGGFGCQPVNQRTSKGPTLVFAAQVFRGPYTLAGSGMDTCCNQIEHFEGLKLVCCPCSCPLVVTRTWHEDCKWAHLHLHSVVPLIIIISVMSHIKYPLTTINPHLQWHRRVMGVVKRHNSSSHQQDLVETWQEG